MAERSSSGLNLATERQLKHRVGTDSQGSFPSGLKLFAQLGCCAGRALSLCASLATPRVPCALLGGTSAPPWSSTRPGISQCRPQHGRRRPRLGHVQMLGGGLDPWTRLCTPVEDKLEKQLSKSARHGVPSTALSSAKGRAQPRSPRPESEWASGARGSALSLRALGCTSTAAHSKEAAPLWHRLAPA